MEYYIIDVETTGVDAKIHEITEVSIIRCKDRVQRTWYLKILHPENCQPQALAITQKTVEELTSRKESLKDVIEQIDSFLEEDKTSPNERVMAAHNAPFDRRFVETWWEKLGRIFPANMWECTMAMTRKHIKNTSPGEKKPKVRLIDALCRFNIKHIKGFHGASPDTKNTYLLRDYLMKNGINEIEFIKKSETALTREKSNIISNDSYDEDVMQEVMTDTNDDLFQF